MIITEKLIEKFINGECSTEEEKAIVRYFEENYSKQDVLDAHGETLMDAQFGPQIDKHISDKILDRIQLAILVKRQRRRKWIAGMSAAAAILLLIFGIRFYYMTGQVKSIAPAAEIVLSNIIKTNTSSVVKNILLPDNSKVQLYPGSSITFLPHFESKRRNIILKGEAVFSVSKDAGRPFTVFSDKISTMALGTRFRVKTSQKDILITLYEGKILVKKSGKSEEEKYYLLPGNAIAYNIPSAHFSLMDNVAKAASVPKTTSRKAAPKTKSPDIIFDNTTMSYALDRLAEKFNVEIEYSPADVQHINIIATISPQQSIEQLLKDITQMNGLILVKAASDKYIIKKNSTGKPLKLSSF